MTMTTTDVLLPVPVAKALHGYLMSRPMEEVEQLVSALRAATPAPSAKTAAPAIHVPTATDGYDARS